jgi:hypothetical protein
MHAEDAPPFAVFEELALSLPKGWDTMLLAQWAYALDSSQTT